MLAILRAITICGAFALAATVQPAFAQDGATPAPPSRAAAEPPAAPVADTPAEIPAEPVAEPAPPKRECHLFGVTWDGGSRAAAQNRSQNALKKTLSDWRRKQGRRSGWLSKNVTIEGHRMRPNPYWRSKVDSNLYYRPNARTATSYTVCWKGVISTAVCTSGAKICK